MLTRCAEQGATKLYFTARHDGLLAGETCFVTEAKEPARMWKHALMAALDRATFASCALRREGLLANTAIPITSHPLFRDSNMPK